MKNKMIFPCGKRYNSLAGRYKAVFGERLQKLVVDAGFGCPNRDGTVGTGGCTFCDNAAFHPGYSSSDKSIIRQLDEGISFHRTRYSRAKKYLAYFQPYTNTHAPLERLKSLYLEALSHPEVVGVVIGTRPDCVDGEKLDFLAALNDGKVLKDWTRDSFSTPLVIVEYGIESCYDRTLSHINRGHDFDCARRAVEMTAARGIDTCGHFILGLPWESREMMLGECGIISSLPLTSVKFHQLQFIKGTKMAAEHMEHPERFAEYDLPDYLDLIADILERLRPDLYIERIAGEIPPRFVEKEVWGRVRNVQILNMLDKRLEERDTWQGRLWDRNGNASK